MLLINRFSGFIALSAVLLSAQAEEYQTLEQRLGYAMGYQYGEILTSKGVTLDVPAFADALSEVLQGKPSQMSAAEMDSAMREANALLLKQKKEQAKLALEKGRTFLQQNKDREGVVTLPSGLQYRVLESGAGESPKGSDRVTINYEGTLLDGEVFDSSLRRGVPATFQVGRVIPGFREALALMKPGAKWRVFIPSELGYGEQGAGDAIGPNEVLTFDLELISFEPGDEEKAE